MHVMSRSVAGYPHPSQYPRSFEHGPHAFHHMKGQYHLDQYTRVQVPHSAPRYVPHLSSASGHNYTPSYSPTWTSPHVDQQQQRARGGAELLFHGLSQSLPVANSKPQAPSQLTAQQTPRPRQGRYSVTNLDFQDFQAANDVASFLRFLRLHKYIEIVEEQGITLSQLVTLTEDELSAIGFRTVGARTRLLKGIDRYHEHKSRAFESVSGASAPSASDDDGLANSDMPGIPDELGHLLGSSWSTASEIDIDSFFTRRDSTGHGDGDALADEILRYLWLGDRESDGALLSRIIGTASLVCMHAQWSLTILFFTAASDETSTTL